jgi:hypothetical protein
MKKHMLILPAFLIAVVALILGATASDSLASGYHHWLPEVDEFDEFEVFIEINATDLDAGLQGKLDGEAWNYANVRGPNGRSIFRLNPNGSLEEHGVTEIQWESNEPPFEPSIEAEYTLDDFLALFPEGNYRALGRTIEESWLFSVAELTHDLPAPPEVTSHEEGDTVQRGSDILVEWNAVTKEYDPDADDPLGVGPDDLDSEIVAYIVVAEYDLVLYPGDEDLEEEISRAVTIDVAGDVLMATIPADFLPDEPAVPYELEFKIEVGAVEESGNTTFLEVPLEVVDAP